MEHRRASDANNKEIVPCVALVKVNFAKRQATNLATLVHEVCPDPTLVNEIAFNIAIHMRHRKILFKIVKQIDFRVFCRDIYIDMDFATSYIASI